MAVLTRARRRWIALLVFLPLSVVAGFMVSGIGSTVWPPVTGWGARLVCDGTIVDQSRHYSSPSGGEGVQAHTMCVTGEGKDAVTTEITWDAILVTMPLYAALVFIALLVFVAPRMGDDPKAEADRPRRSPTLLDIGEGRMPRDAADLMDRVAAALRQGQGNVIVRGMPFGPGSGDVAARLEELRDLHARGLISAEEYAAKRADVLAGL